MWEHTSLGVSIEEIERHFDSLTRSSGRNYLLKAASDFARGALLVCDSEAQVK